MRLDLAHTHIVLSEFINGDLGLHEVVVEDNDLSAEGPLLLVMVLRLPHRQWWGVGKENQ